LDAEHIARTLGGAKKTGSDWSCKCPAHEDNRASLSVGHGRDGKLVVHCHAGCDQDTVIAHLKILDLWPSAKAAPRFEPPPVKVHIGQGRGQIVATYDYADEHGELLYQAVRYDPKDFRQRRPVGSGWNWSIKGVRRVIYRMAEVMQAVADGQTIYICEGEKDVENARALGLVATCNAMGADNGSGNKWLPEFADVLVNADVVVVPDQDEPGQRHAAWVVQTLKGKARNIGLLNVRQGKDLSDWIDSGATVSDIEGAIVDAIEVEVPPPKDEPAPAKEHEPMFVAVGDLVDNLQPIQWLIEDYIETDSLSLVYGAPGGGKSFVTVDMACCVATGTPWHGRPVKQGAVFYIAGEGHNGLARRFAAWSRHSGVSLKGVALFKSRRAVSIFNEASAKELHDEITVMVEQTGSVPSLVVIDTVARNFGDGDENSTADMGKFVEHLDKWVRHPFGCNINLVHHSGHNMDRARGSSALKAALDAEYSVVNEGGVVTLAATKMKDAEMPSELTFKFKVVELGEVGGAEINSVVLEVATAGMDFKVGQDSDHQDIVAKQVVEVVAKGWLPYSELKDALNCTASTAKRVVQRCAEKGLLDKDGQGYKLAEKASQLLSLTGANLKRKDKGTPIWKRGNDD
jgi:5S rRNA maturation endonuclease (ribonuclease M5)